MGYYRPHFAIYPLWNEDLLNCLKFPPVFIEFRDNKNLQINIPYLKHDAFFPEISAAVKAQLMLSFEGNLTLSELIIAIEAYAQTITAKSAGDGNRSNLLAFELFLSVYVGNVEKSNAIFEQIEKESKLWKMDQFKTWHGKFDVWLSGLKSQANERQSLIDRVEINRADKKIKKLPKSTLV